MNHQSTIKLLENRMKATTSDPRFELHQDFQLLYSIMNGQDFTSPVRRLDGLFNATPLFGVIQVYDLELLSYFVSIDLILQFIDRQEFIIMHSDFDTYFFSYDRKELPRNPLHSSLTIVNIKL